MAEISTQEQAEPVRDTVWQADKASRWLGMTCEHSAPRKATLPMKLEARHCNSEKAYHGGIRYAPGHF